MESSQAAPIIYAHSDNVSQTCTPRSMRFLTVYGLKKIFFEQGFYTYTPPSEFETSAPHPTQTGPRKDDVTLVSQSVKK